MDGYETEVTVFTKQNGGCLMKRLQYCSKNTY